MRTWTISGGIFGIGALLAGIVAIQEINPPWVPREEVKKIADMATGNAVFNAVTRKESLEGQLLRNRIQQGVYVEDGERVPTLYLEQEQKFEQQLERAQRKLDSLEGK